jgi:hypothetical protein
MKSPSRIGVTSILGLLAVSISQSSFAAVSHVVQVSVDGLGAIYLQSYVSNAPAQFPNFLRLQTEGAFTYNARCDFGASETIPNHTSMFTGRPSLQPAGYPNTVHHGCINNAPFPTDTYHNSGNPNVDYMASVFDVAHDHGLSTALYAGKAKFFLCDNSYDANNGGLDLVLPDYGRDKIDFSYIGDFDPYYGNGTTFTQHINVAVSNLNSAAPKNFTFLHIPEPDLRGHTTGWNDAGGIYSNMVRQVDAQIGRILNAIDTNPILSNNTALIVTTDHGGVDGGHSDPLRYQSYTIFFYLRGPGIPAGVDLYTLFPNRANPGTNRLDYTVVPQPLRNGDSGNLVLTLLGLPPIPDSLMRPFFNPDGILLTMSKTGAGAELSWPADATAFTLEASPALGATALWTGITSGISVDGQRNVFPINTAADAGKFYRLRKL